MPAKNEDQRKLAGIALSMKEARHLRDIPAKPARWLAA